MVDIEMAALTTKLQDSALSSAKKVIIKKNWLSSENH